MMKFIKILLLYFMMNVANAGMVTVNHVSWDTQYNDGGEQDFISSFFFSQWYSLTDSPYNNITNYNSAVSIGNIVTWMNTPSDTSKRYLQGTAEINKVNGSESFMDPGYELNLIFGGLEYKKNNSFDATNGWASIMVNSIGSHPNPTDPLYNYENYINPTSNQTEINYAEQGTEWLRIKILDLSGLTGSVVSGGASAHLEIVGGVAKDYFDPALFDYVGSSFFAGTLTPINNARYSAGGTGSLQGNSIAISEPNVIILFLTTLGFLVTYSRKTVLIRDTSSKLYI